jgi:hypothetical protein
MNIIAILSQLPDCGTHAECAKLISDVAVRDMSSDVN